MKHPHAEILKAYAEDTSVEIECYNPDRLWEAIGIDSVIDYPSFKYRLKPAMRSITLQDGTVVEWPEPMRVVPKGECAVWVVECWVVSMALWNNNCTWLDAAIKTGFCHATEEAAQQHRKAIVLANGGEL